MTGLGSGAADDRKYNDTALHFDVDCLPSLLERHMPPGPIALADLGCGDGPHFALLDRTGRIGPARPVYAVDLEAMRLARVSRRFPYIKTIVGPSDHVPEIPDGSVDLVISTMVMEHVPDERRYLDEIRRMLAPRGRAYITTVYKRGWAWYFRKRNGEPVLDPSHLREYTDLGAFKDLVMEGARFTKLLAVEVEQLWFPLLDPLLFRLTTDLGALAANPDVIRRLRKPKLPIPGYYSLNIVIER